MASRPWPGLLPEAALLHEQLHKNGYVVVKGVDWNAVDEIVLSYGDLRRCRFYHGSQELLDKGHIGEEVKRKIYALRDRLVGAVDLNLLDVLGPGHMWRKGLGFWGPKHCGSDVMALRSLPGCDRQPWHWDFNPDNLAGMSDEQMPLSCVVALQDSTRFHFKSNGCRNEDGETVTIEAGDLLIFRGDMLHAGAAYEEENWRLHMYLDVAHDDDEFCRSVREPNTTYFP